MTEVNSNEESIHVVPIVMWNVKVFFQGLLVGIIYGIFLYFGMISVLGSCSKCIDLLNSITSPCLSLLEMISGTITSNSFEADKITFKTSEEIAFRIGSNVIFIWLLFYAIFTRFRLNVKTVHLAALSILLMVFLGVSSFTIVSVIDGSKGSIITYVAVFVTACIILGYAASIKFKLNPESTFKEVFLTICLIWLLAFLAIFPLIKFS
jgi:hypothetical protein